MKIGRLLVWLLFMGAMLVAQEFRGTFSGAVTDPHGAPVAHARIIAVENRTQTKSETVTDSAGQYTLPFLAPGIYSVTAELAGFKRYQRRGITLESGEHPVIDIALQLGDFNQSVTVAADVGMIETANASTGQVITSQQVDDLPLNGRTPMMFAQLALGVISTTTLSTAVHPFDNGGVSSISMGGAPGSSNELLLDGAADGTWDERVAYNAPQDAVLEVRVHAFQPDAGYGHTGGGTAEQLTRSGTNILHGSAYDFNQVSRLAAQNFFTNRYGLPAAQTVYNQYGLSAGAPVILPRLFNGKNRLFWFFAWESVRWNTPAGVLTSVPTDTEKKGDFSALLKGGAAYQIYDPLTAALSGVHIQRVPFPNNVIPANRLNPIALNYLKYYPEPNLPGLPDGIDNFGTSTPNTVSYNNELTRMDYSVNDRHKVFGTFRHNFSVSDADHYLGPGNPAAGRSLSRTNWGAMLDDVYTFNASTVFNVRANWTRFYERHWQDSLGISPTSLGFPAYMSALSQLAEMPTIVLENYESLSHGVATVYNPYDVFQVLGDLAKIVSTHSLRAGVDAREYRLSGINYGTDQSGSFSFNQVWVNGPLNTSAAAPAGQDLAAFVLGLPSSGSYSQDAYSTVQSKYFAAFLQDDWRAHSRLTLNFGVRFEHETPTSERYGRLIDGFNGSAPNAISSAAAAAYAANPVPGLPASTFNTLGGLTFASKANPNAFSTVSKIFSPRFGFAWTPRQLGSGTVVRGGVGMFVYPIGTVGINQLGYTQVTQFVATNNSFLSPANTLSDPFPNGILQPVGSSLGTSTYLGQGIVFNNPFPRNPYSVRYEMGIQRQMGLNAIFEVAYIGNHSVHLPVNTQLDYIPRQYLSALPVRDQATISKLTGVARNPFAGLLPNSSSLNGTTVALSQLLIPFPQYPVGSGASNGVVMQNNSAGSSYFHSLNVRVQKRMSGGFSLIENFMYSKLMARTTRLNDSDPSLYSQISPDCRPLRNVLAVTYGLPVGKGKAVDLKSRWLDAIGGGWTVNGIYTLQSGAPLDFTSNMLYNGGALNFDPRQVNGPSFDIARFNTVPAQQLADNIRQFPMMFNNLRVDGMNNLDASLLKAIAIRERLKLQIRLEAFNVVNHPVFAAPNLTPTSSAFGLITAQFNQPRNIQLGGRLIW